MIPKRTRWPGGAVVTALLLLAGCAQLLKYPVAQDEIQAHLDEQLDPLRGVELDSALAAFDFSVREAEVTLGPAGATDRVQLDVTGEAGVDSLMGQQSAAVDLRLRGLPDYDAEAGAVYVRDLELVSSHVDAGWLSGEVTGVIDPVVALISDHLAHTPVYELDRDSAAGQALGSVPAEVRVEPGRLVLTPR